MYVCMHKYINRCNLFIYIYIYIHVSENICVFVFVNMIRNKNSFSGDTNFVTAFIWNIGSQILFALPVAVAHLGLLTVHKTYLT